jgi:hypothetical protein
LRAVGSSELLGAAFGKCLAEPAYGSWPLVEMCRLSYILILAAISDL